MLEPQLLAGQTLTAGLAARAMATPTDRASRAGLQPVDQAHGLRRMFGRQTVRLLPVVASAGWADAQALVLDMAMRWAQDGRHVLVLDGQGTPTPEVWDMRDVLEGHASFDEAAEQMVPGVWLLPAREGLTTLSEQGHVARTLLEAAAALPQGIDMVILLAPAPIVAALCAGEAVLPLVLAADGPQDLTDAYLTLKILATEGGLSRCGLVLADRGAPARARQAAHRISECARRFFSGDTHVAVIVPLQGANTEDSLNTLARRAVDHALSRDVDMPVGARPMAVHSLN